MTLIVNLPDSLEHELVLAADQHGLPLPEYIVQLLTRWKLLETEKQSESEREYVDRVLAASGRVLLPLSTTSSHLDTGQIPVPMMGQPVSEIAIEQRG